MRHYTLLNRIFPKVMAVLLVLTLLMPLAPAASAAESGSCGVELEWSFDTGTLTITGKGAMTDYSKPEDAPWYGFREQITRLVLPDGLTRVGRMAFYGCTGITAVSIPAAVKTIGDMAFMECSAMAVLHLPEGLESIGKSAFERCTSLRDLRLPGTLKNLQKQAFYRCVSLKSVEIPRSVTEMGVGVFSYCENLMQATVRAPLNRLPSRTFYGCTRLTSIDLAAEIKSVGAYSVYDCECLSVIYYGGEPGDAEELEAQISEGNEHFGRYGSVEEEKQENSESYNGADTDEDGHLIVEDTTVTQTENSTITTTTENNVTNEEAEELPTQIDATIITDEGWEELVDQIEESMTDSGVNVEVYLPVDSEIPQEVIDALAGQDVQMEVTTANGDSYTLDFTMIGTVKLKNGLDLSYTLTLAEKVKYEQLQGFTVYELDFSASSEIPVGVAIQLPLENVRATASLYQVRSGKLEHLQAAVVDQKGVVHFYLASVDKGTTYFIGINIAGVDEAYIPESLEGEYGITEQIQNVDYVITGRKSSWGIGFLEVNKILFGIMLSTAAIVGLLVYASNKRKLRKGVIPGWEDDDEI